MTDFRDGPGATERLALAMVENAAVVDGGRTFAVMTYVLEGNDPLILGANRAFNELDELVGLKNSGMCRIYLIILSFCLHF